MIFTFKIKVDDEIEIKANTEDNAWKQLEEYINTEHFEKNIELSRVDCSDEQEAEERARDRYEALQEDRAMEMARGDNLMKSAKEMFEELGYRLDDCSSDEKGIEYVYINFNAEKDINKEIAFTEKTKEIEMYDYNHFSFSIDEIKAVNMQLKELGWL